MLESNGLADVIAPPGLFDEAFLERATADLESKGLRG